MHLHRNFVIPVLLIAGSAIALPCSAIPLEATTTGAASALAKRVFSAGSLPMDPGVAWLTDAPAQNPATTGDIPLPEGKGRDLAIKSCSTCHATNIWAVQHHTRDEWSSVIDN